MTETMKLDDTAPDAEYTVAADHDWGRDAVRVDLYLSRDEHRQLKLYSAETGRPMADILRDAVRSIIEDVKQRESSRNEGAQQAFNQSRMPPRTTLGKIFFIIEPLLITAAAALIAAFLCFLYRVSDYNLDPWQYWSMLKLIFTDDEYRLNERMYILFSGLWGMIVVGVPVALAYQDTANMWAREGKW